MKSAEVKDRALGLQLLSVLAESAGDQMKKNLKVGLTYLKHFVYPPLIKSLKIWFDPPFRGTI